MNWIFLILDEVYEVKSEPQSPNEKGTRTVNSGVVVLNKQLLLNI